MKTSKFTLILLTYAALCSCHNASTSQTGAAQNDGMVVNAAHTVSTNDEMVEDTITDINFKEFSISINRLVIDDEDKEITQVQKDTVETYAEVGETIEGQRIVLISDQLNHFTVEQRYETSVTIMNEGPHCDLTDWKHFYSEWKPLKSNHKGQFICAKYSNKDSEKFPKVSIDELKQKVKAYCGDEGFKLIENIKSPTEYPSGVGISRYFLRVTGQRHDNGQSVTKLIIITMPMGC